MEGRSVTLSRRLAETCSTCAPLLELAEDAAKEDYVIVSCIPARVCDRGISVLEEWAAANRKDNDADWMRTSWLPAHKEASIAADFFGCTAFLEFSALASLLFLRHASDVDISDLVDGRCPAQSTQFPDNIFDDLDHDLTATPSRTRLTPDQMSRLAIGIDKSGLVYVPVPEIIKVFRRLNLRATCSTERDEQAVYHANADQVYLEFELSADLLKAYKVVALEFAAEAHDQGWSSNNPDHFGTETGSFTWSDIALVSAANGAEIARSTRWYTNLHAVSRWQTRKLMLPQQSLIFERLQEAAQIQSGARIQIRVCAMFPGWRHYIRYARIDVHMLPL